MTAQPQHYTCIGKGGVYEMVGPAQGAGELRGTFCVVYRDTHTGQLYVRNVPDFAARMTPIESQT